MCRAKVAGGRRCRKHLLMEKHEINSRLRFIAKNPNLAEYGEHRDLTGQLDRVNAELDASRDGYLELTESLVDLKPADPEYAAIKSRIEAADALRKKRRDAESATKIEVKSFKKAMSEIGVEEVEQNELLHLMASFERSSFPKASAFYKGRLDRAKEKLAQRRALHKARLEAIATDPKLSNKEKEDAAKQETRAYIEEREALGAKVRQARRDFDATPQGQQQLAEETEANLEALEKIEATVSRHQALVQDLVVDREALKKAKAKSAPMAEVYGLTKRVEAAAAKVKASEREVEEAEYELSTLKMPQEVSKVGDVSLVANAYARFQSQRLEVAQAIREKQVKDRRITDTFKREVKKAVLAVGGTEADCERALKSYRNPQIERARVRRGLTVSSALTDDELRKVSEMGPVEAKRRILTIPTIPAGTTPQTDAVLGKSHEGPGRNRTIQLGERREAIKTFTLTPEENSQVEERARMVHTTKSSYMRAMLLGENIWKLENDRSAEHHTEKVRAFEEAVA